MLRSSLIATKSLYRRDCEFQQGSLRKLMLGTEIGDLAITMLLNLAYLHLHLLPHIIFDVPATIPFIGNGYSRTTKTNDKSLILLSPLWKHDVQLACGQYLKLFG